MIRLVVLLFAFAVSDADNANAGLPSSSTLLEQTINVTRVVRNRRDLQTNPSFIAQNGLVVMEAESVPVVSPWVMETSAAGYLGKGHLRFNGNTDAGGPPNGRMRYFFDIDKPGNYRLIMRLLKTNDEEGHLGNDCYTKLVGHSGYQGSDVKTFMRGRLANRRWHFDTQFDLNHVPTTPVYNLGKAGTYEFQLIGRSRNFFVDRIILYRQGSVNHAFATNTLRPESPRTGEVHVYSQANFTKFTLMTAGNAEDTPIREIKDGDVIDYAEVGGTSLSIIAEVEGEPSAIKFYYADTVWRETGAPYAMSGNNGLSMNPVSYLEGTGDKKVLAMAFTNGILQDKLEVNFSLVNSAPTLGPTVPPTTAPTQAPVTQAPTTSPTTASPTVEGQTRPPSKAPTSVFVPEPWPLELGSNNAESERAVDNSSSPSSLAWTRATLTAAAVCSVLFL